MSKSHYGSASYCILLNSIPLIRRLVKIQNSFHKVEWINKIRTFNKLKRLHYSWYYMQQRGLNFLRVGFLGGFMTDLPFLLLTSYLLFSDILQPQLQPDLRWRSLWICCSFASEPKPSGAKVSFWGGRLQHIHTHWIYEWPSILLLLDILRPCSPYTLVLRVKTVRLSSSYLVM